MQLSQILDRDIYAYNRWLSDIQSNAKRTLYFQYRIAAPIISGIGFLCGWYYEVKCVLDSTEVAPLSIPFCGFFQKIGKLGLHIVSTFTLSVVIYP